MTVALLFIASLFTNITFAHASAFPDTEEQKTSTSLPMQHFNGSKVVAPNFSIAEVFKALHVSSSVFRNFFQEHTGQSFGCYIKEFRKSYPEEYQESMRLLTRFKAAMMSVGFRDNLVREFAVVNLMVNFELLDIENFGTTGHPLSAYEARVFEALFSSETGQTYIEEKGKSTPPAFLDVGCGYSRILLSAAMLGAKCVGIDQSETILARFKDDLEKLKQDKSGLHLDINLTVGDARQESPEGFEQYDVAMVNRVLYFLSFEDQVKLLKNTYAQLKPGGHLFAWTLSPYVGTHYISESMETGEERLKVRPH